MHTKIEVPNIDDHGVDPSEIDELRKEFVEIRDAMNELQAYCEMKRRAMTNRLSGRMSHAVKFEEAMEIIYKKLPEWARW